MTQPALESSLASIAAAYAQNVGAPAPQAPAAPQVPPGHYLASDGRIYPLPNQAPAAPPPPPAPAPQAPPPAQSFAPPQALPQPPPAPQAPQAPPTHAIPPEQSALAIQTHLSQPLPINPPEAVGALDPSLPAPEPRKRGRGKGKTTTPMQAAADADQAGISLQELLAGVAGLLPKGCSVTVQGEG